MAFTLRLTPAQDRALEGLAKRLGVSKNEAAKQAILLAANDGTSHPRLVKAAAQGVIERDANLLQRLADA
ncbi:MULTISPECIES: ribbon-helix-helix protein, CopG family [unclassified Salinibacterium]|uniref:ribbon-helix-helix protein, CopG family n=1 Tax=unclassified Salinibacterium TaxID=2632331 RepID=UPI001424A29E|nr:MULTISPECIES: ribbon-helix-helix protein, CopG family [unclassified Salinibacterium]